MADEDRRNRIVDIIDVVKDNVSDFLRNILNPCLSKHGLLWGWAKFFFILKLKANTSYDDAERDDPTIYTSEKTGRGPLNEDWIEEYWSECKGMEQPTKNGYAIMCAYKLCKVEFRYWGMQSKIER